MTKTFYSIAVYCILALSLGLLLLPRRQPATTQAANKQNGSTQAAVWRERYAQLPLRFEQNVGQTNAAVQFLARGQGYNLFLTANEAVLEMRSTSVLRMQLLNANPAPRISGAAPLPGLSHYLQGNDGQRWRRNVRGFAQVVYRDVWPGIELVYYGQQRQLEYDFRLAPGARAEQIRWQIIGANKLQLDEQGNLRLQVGAETVTWLRPQAWQERAGQRQNVACEYLIEPRGQISFRLGAYDRRLPLVIDPALAYLRYVGGTGMENGLGIAVDASGAAYICGQTDSPDFPSAALPGGNARKREAFVLKLDSAGTNVVYATYFGGANDEVANAIAVDAAGNAYFTGETASSDLPTTANAAQRILAGGVDGFVAKLNPAGSALVYASYLGGSEDDRALDLALDASGNAYLSGATFSANFPGTNAAVKKAGASLYRSTDQAGNWNASTNSLTASEVIALAVSPQNAETIFAASRRALYRSTDGGNQWQRLGAPLLTEPPIPTLDSAELRVHGIFALALDPQNATTIYLATGDGVFKSTDGGTSFTRKSAGLPSDEAVMTVTFAPSNAGLFVGTLRGVYRSTNGGESWSLLNNSFGGRIRQLVFDPTNPAICYAATLTGVFKTTNGGNNWSQQFLFTGAGGMPVSALALDPHAPQTLYAGGYAYGPAVLFKTTDGGANWQLSQTGLSDGNYYVHPGVRALAIAPNNSAIVYAATDYGVYKTSNGGASWSLSNSGLANRDAYALAILPGNNGALLAGTNAGSDAFAVKLKAAGSALLYTALLGGSENETANSLALDAAGNAWLAGVAQSRDFPRVRALQANHGGALDAFVAQLDAAGNNWLLASLLGGAANDQATALALDGAGNVYVTGFTESPDFPKVNALAGLTNTAAPDAFVSKIKADGSALEYSTYLGGNVTDRAYGIAVDAAGNVVVTGETDSPNFPQVGSLQPFPVQGAEIFVSRLNPNGTRLLFSTLLSSGGNEQGKDVALDARGNIYLAGTTSSPYFPSASTVPVLKGPTDAFVLKLAPAVELAVTMTDQPDPVRFGSNLTYTLTVTNRGEVAATGVTLNDQLPAGARLVSATAGQGSCSGTTTVTCNLGTLAVDGRTTVTLVIAPPAQREITNTATVSSNEADGSRDNNTATEKTTVDYADLALSLTVAQTQAAPGSTLTWLLTVSNPGPATVENIVISDTLPAQVTFVNCQITGAGVCGGNGNARTITVPSLAANAAVTATLAATINNNVAPGTVINNTASLNAIALDPVSANNQAATSTTVVPANNNSRQNGRLLYLPTLSQQTPPYVVNPDGTRAMPMNGVPYGPPRWSPDGTRLALGLDNRIIIYNADGTLNRTVTLTLGAVGVLDWTPDGAHFVIYVDRNLYLINTDGTGTRRLFEVPFSSISSPRLSPDGLKLAFTYLSLYTINLDGSGLKQLTETRLGNETDYDLNWSPDGARIVFASRRDEGLSYKLYSIKPDGTGLTKLTDGPNDRWPVFAPDGAKIAFSRNGELYTINPDGSSPRPLANPAIRGFKLEWQRLPQGPQPNHYLLTGRVADNNGRVYPTSVRLNGTRNFEAMLDERGVYTFGLLPEGGNYTVTPGAITGARIEPSTRSYTNLRGDVGDANFTVTPLVYSISGRITDRNGQGLGGLNISLLDSFGHYTQTDAEGRYLFPYVRGGQGYSVQPSGYTARDLPQPVGSANIALLDGDKVVNFVGNRLNFNVSGSVTNSDDSSLSGATLTLVGGNQSYTASTNANGRYTFANIPAGFLYTLSAAKPGVTIGPATRRFILNAEQPLNFFASATALATVSAASFSPQHLVPDGLAVLFGSELSATTRAATSLPLPIELDGVSVTVTTGLVNDLDCQLLFVSPRQINFLLYLGAPPPPRGEVMVTVKRNGRVVAAGTFPFEPVAPSLFSANATGQGVAAAVALRVRANGTQVYEPVARYDTNTRRYVPIPLDLSNPNEQVFLILFGMGFRFKNEYAVVEARMGGSLVPVTYAGAQGQSLAGVDQTNLLIPNSLAGRGEVDVTLTIDGKTSNVVKIALR